MAFQLPGNWNSLSELSRITTLITTFVFGTYVKKRFVAVDNEIEPVGDEVSINDLLKNAQLMQVKAYNSDGEELTAADFLSKIASLDNFTARENDYFRQCISSEVPAQVAFDIQNWVFGEEDNLAITLNTGHGITRIRFTYLPPLYLVVE